MSALFALFFFIAPARAGVVAPVESAVAPAGSAIGAVPVLAPAGGSLAAPSYGGADLRGGLPLLPAPVPGLIGMPALNFIGSAPEAAAAHPEAAAASAAPATSAPETAAPARGRAEPLTPALPGKPAPGSSALAISRDRRAAAATPENGVTLSGALAREAAAAAPEDAMGAGKNFFDQSADKNRAALAAPASSPEAGSGNGKPVLVDGSGATPARGGAAFSGGATPGAGAGRGRTNDLHVYAPEEEALRDAVASALPAGAGAGPAAPGGAALYFRSAAPNGELPGGPSAALPAVAAVPAPGAPSPLALELSRTGLIVRVRSALNEAFSFAPAAAGSPAPVAPGPSTALLERGAMLEAFSVSRAYAEAPLGGRRIEAGVSRAASAPFAPEASPIAATLSLWWAWLVLPFAALAFRGL